jgi:hypothetical protein
MGTYWARGSRRGGSPRSPCFAKLLNLWRDFWWTHLDSNQGPLACEMRNLLGEHVGRGGRDESKRDYVDEGWAGRNRPR